MTSEKAKSMGKAEGKTRDHYQDKPRSVPDQIKKLLQQLYEAITRHHQALAKNQKQLATGLRSLRHDTHELRETLDRLSGRCEACRQHLIDKIENLLDEHLKPADTSLLEAIGMSIRQYDELLGQLADTGGNPRYHEELLAAVKGMRGEAETLLAMHDVELINSVERFDPGKHRAIGTCPRPEGATGDGKLRRIGLLHRNQDRQKVLKPALVVIYDDVET